MADCRPDPGPDQPGRNEPLQRRDSMNPGDVQTHYLLEKTIENLESKRSEAAA